MHTKTKISKGDIKTMEVKLLNSTMTLTFSGNRRRTFSGIKAEATNGKLFSTATAMADLVRPALNKIQRTTNELLSR